MAIIFGPIKASGSPDDTTLAKLSVSLAGIGAGVITLAVNISCIDSVGAVTNYYPHYLITIPGIPQLDASGPLPLAGPLSEGCVSLGVGLTGKTVNVQYQIGKASKGSTTTITYEISGPGGLISTDSFASLNPSAGVEVIDVNIIF